MAYLLQAAVIRSKQFPFSFLSCYQAIEDLLDKEAFTKKLKEKNEKDVSSKKSDEWWVKRKTAKLASKM